jgi:hypothetical protein
MTNEINKYEMEAQLPKELPQEDKDNLVTIIGNICAQIVAKESDKAFQKGFEAGLLRHTWMKDGTTYVGNATYTLKEAIEMAIKDGLLPEHYNGR